MKVLCYLSSSRKESLFSDAFPGSPVMAPHGVVGKKEPTRQHCEYTVFCFISTVLFSASPPPYVCTCATVPRPEDNMVA